MSNVRVCDRCGKRVDKNGLEIEITPYKFHRFLVNVEREYSHEMHDLCAECKREFNAFIAGANARVAYICDRTACEKCNPECHHVFDVHHAKNFECIAENEYWEKETSTPEIKDASSYFLTPEDGEVPLDECPIGLFEVNGELCMKTEYYTATSDGLIRIDAYIVSTGERCCIEHDALVKPCSIWVADGE